MRGFWVLVHVLGFTLWLGGGIATMVAGVSAKGFAPAERLAAYKLIGAIQRILVGPGAMAVLLSGLVLAMPYMKQGAVPGWMGLMMIAGIIGALGAVAISVPTAAKLARLEVDARGLRARAVVTPHPRLSRGPRTGCSSRARGPCRPALRTARRGAGTSVPGWLPPRTPGSSRGW